MKRNDLRPGTNVITRSGTHASVVRKRYHACLIEYAQGDVTCGEWHRVDTLKIDNYQRRVTMDPHAICSACGQHWTTTDVEAATPDEIPPFWERVSPGDVMPLGICPACEGLCLPTWGPAHEQRQQLTALHACLADLLQWHNRMGGWQAPCWRAAKRLRRLHRP